MRLPRLWSLTLLAVPVVAAGSFSACSSDNEPTPPASTTAGTGGSGGMGGTGGSGGLPDPTAVCEELALPMRAFAEGPYGIHRGEVADDFTIDLADGTPWNLRDRFSGCESYVFVPDRIPVSDLDDASVWESDKDLASLVENSPRNVHWFFVSRHADAHADASIQGMQARIDALLATLEATDAAHWKARLHVVAAKAGDLDGWIGDAISTHGRIGFGIDRTQRVRGAGYLADVSRYSAQLEGAGAWPWKSNLAYAAHEAQYFNAQATIYERLEAEEATVVPLFSGEILEELEDTEIMLPSAAEMAAFDTLEIEVTMQCPDPEEIELGNCGAWDYLANLFVQDASLNFVELARFITTYHREAHWVVDATPMLALLRDGGLRTFRWSFAPSWNTQPMATHLSLRFSSKAKGVTPTQATFLWAGGPFNATYNTTHAPSDVPIPAAAQKVELWSLVTGHGAATSQCAEFCNHEHELTINGVAYTREHPEAATENGCIGQLDHGMTPNQAGTWWFGRGGWCPGQQVEPWVVDVTAAVTPGQTAAVTYRGLLDGMDPPDNAGDIVFTSYLVVYE